jgi:hypothetical protein
LEREEQVGEVKFAGTCVAMVAEAQLLAGRPLEIIEPQCPDAGVAHTFRHYIRTVVEALEEVAHHYLDECVAAFRLRYFIAHLPTGDSPTAEPPTAVQDLRTYIPEPYDPAAVADRVDRLNIYDVAGHAVHRLELLGPFGEKMALYRGCIETGVESFIDLDLGLVDLPFDPENATDIGPEGARVLFGWRGAWLLVDELMRYNMVGPGDALKWVVSVHRLLTLFEHMVFAVRDGKKAPLPGTGTPEWSLMSLGMILDQLGPPVQYPPFPLDGD